MRARVIDENTSHHLRRDSKKLRPILPAHAVLLGKFQEKLVDECGWLQRVFASFSAQVGDGEAVQLVVNERHQLVAGVFLTLAPSFEQLCDACGRTIRHSLSLSAWRNH